MKNALLASFVLASSLCATAQPVLVKDINPGTSSSYPSWISGYKNKIVFFATDGVNGYELNVLDSTARLQYDLNPGAADGGINGNVHQMAVIGNNLYMVGDNGATGPELYMWNGNDSSAPVLVADLNAGLGGSYTSEMFVMDGKLYFDAYTPTYGTELYSYNPATNYLQRLTDLYAGASGSYPHNFINYNGKLYFTATSNTLGAEMYMYDPVANTTTNVMDIVTGVTGSDPQGQIVVGSKIYFSAYTPAYGRELYTYDGKNLSRLTNIDNGPFDGVVSVSPGHSQLIWFKNMLFFSGDNAVSGAQLYSYNPVNGVTSMVFAINPSAASYPQQFTYYGGKLFFSADDGTNGIELWSFDGKMQPMLVADIDSGISSGFPENFLRYGTKLYFAATNSNTGTELYSISDSAALTVQNIKFAGEVAVYPNPTTGTAQLQVTLNAAQQLAYTITDVTGKVVAKANTTAYNAGKNTISIDLSNATNGIYIYRLTDNNGVLMASGRIEKQ